MRFDFKRAAGWGGLLAAAFLNAACPNPGTTCDSQACPNGQICDPGTLLCRRLLPPSIVISSPDGGLIGGATVVLSGTATADDGNGVQLSYRTLDGGAVALSATRDGVFNALLPLPAGFDGQPFPIEVTAVDDFQNSASVTVTPIVDTVPPTFIFVPADLTMSAPLSLKIVASEPFGPMTFQSSPGPQISPIPPGGTNVIFTDAGELTVSGLASYTTYTAAEPAGVLFDRVGLSNVDGGIARFLTAPVTPPTQDISLGTSVIADFSSAAGNDGVVTLVIKYGPVANPTNYSYYWAMFDPITGVLTNLNTVTDINATYFQATAQTTFLPNFQTLQVSGFFKGVPGSAVSANWSSNGTPGSDSTGVVVIPTPSSCAETASTSTGQVGEITEPSAGVFNYVRPPNAARAMTFQPEFLQVRSNNSWEAYGLAGSTLSRQQFDASCDGGIRFVSDTPLTDVANGSTLSLALAQSGQSLYVYDKQSAARTEVCTFCVTGAGSDCHIAPDTLGGTGLTVSSMHNGGNVLGARLNAAGAVEIVQRDLSPTCGGTWSVLGTVPASTGSTKFEPQMFGLKPGVFFLNSSGLHVYTMP